MLQYNFNDALNIYLKLNIYDIFIIIIINYLKLRLKLSVEK